MLERLHIARSGSLRVPLAAAAAIRPQAYANRWQQRRELAGVVVAKAAGDGDGDGDGKNVITATELIRGCFAYVAIWGLAVETGAAIAFTPPPFPAVGASLVRAGAFAVLLAVPEIAASWPVPALRWDALRLNVIVRGAVLGATAAAVSALALSSSNPTDMPASEKIAQLGGGGANAGGVNILCVILSAAFFAPAAEELFFRGPLYCGLKTAANLESRPWVARGVSAATFSLWHLVGDPSLSYAAISQLAMLGCVCTLAADPVLKPKDAAPAIDQGGNVDDRDGNESFVAAVVCHGTYNAIVLASQFLAAIC